MTLLRYPDLKQKGIPYSRVHVDRLEKAGKFPKRVHIGENAVAWVEDEIDALIASKVAERETA